MSIKVEKAEKDRLHAAHTKAPRVSQSKAEADPDESSDTFESNSDSDSDGGKNSSPRCTDTTLPSGSNEALKTHFIPTFKGWIGEHEDPWNIDDADMAAEMERIWNEMRPQDQLRIQPHTPVYRVVCPKHFLRKNLC